MISADLLLPYLADPGTMSGCKRKTVQASVFGLDGELKAQAYNGPAEGHECSNEVGNCGCEHAEPKVLGMLQADVPLIMAVTYSPCTKCAEAIIAHSGVRMVAFKWMTYHDLGGLALLMEQGILVVTETYLRQCSISAQHA